MQETWGTTTPVQRFWARLKRNRAREFMRDVPYMKSLRFNYKVACDMQKMHGDVWAEYGTDVFRLIAEAHGETWDGGTDVFHLAEEAHGETWDSEDEEKKKGPAVKPKGKDLKHDDLVAAREKSPCRGLDQLQGEPEEGLSELEEDEGLQGRQLWRRKGGAEEEAKGPSRPQKEEEVHRLRREGFYRTAGGCP